MWCHHRWCRLACCPCVRATLWCAAADTLCQQNLQGGTCQVPFNLLVTWPTCVCCGRTQQLLHKAYKNTLPISLQRGRQFTCMTCMDYCCCCRRCTRGPTWQAALTLWSPASSLTLHTTSWSTWRSYTSEGGGAGRHAQAGCGCCGCIKSLRVCCVHTWTC